MKMRILIEKRCIPVKVEANWFRGGQRGEGCLFQDDEIPGLIILSSDIAELQIFVARISRFLVVNSESSEFKFPSLYGDSV